MINSLESGFDSHVSFNVRSGPAPQGVQKKRGLWRKDVHFLLKSLYKSVFDWLLLWL